MSDSLKYLVKINVSEGSDACPLNQVENFIHQRELDLVIGHLDQSLKDAQKYKKDLEEEKYSRRHNTITIAGSRGSGKNYFCT